jgi:GT2 family glycosyltransferase
VVVDNYSVPAEVRAVTELAAEAGWLTVLCPTNQGFGAGVNRGAAAAIARGASRLLLLNPDASIDRSDLAILDARVRADGNVLAMPRILNPDGSLHAAGTDVLLARGDMRSFHNREVSTGSAFLPWLTAACLVTSAALWQRLGGFDEDYFLYWEDVDLSVRAQRLGARLEVVEEAVAVHDEGATHRDSTTTTENAKSETYYFYNTRNRLLFARKNLSPADQRRWLRGSVGAAYRIVLRGGRRQLLRSASPLRGAIRGTWAGARAGKAGEAGRNAAD